MTTIGVQAMMLKDEFAEHGPFEVLRRVREIGYRAVEVSQVPMTAANVAELRRTVDELGMDIAALSASLAARPGGESLTDDFDTIVADAKRLGATMIRIGMLPIEATASVDALLDFCRRTNDAARRLADLGIRLCYHNHHVEFATHEGRHLLDVIADHAPDVGLEIDVHWVQRGGLDPVTTLRKYGDRVAMVHLKDYRIGPFPRRRPPRSPRATPRRSWPPSPAWSSSRRWGRATSISPPSCRRASRSGRSTCSSSRTSATVARPSTASPRRMTTSWPSASGICSEGGADERDTVGRLDAVGLR